MSGPSHRSGRVRPGGPDDDGRDDGRDDGVRRGRPVWAYVALGVLVAVVLVLILAGEIRLLPSDEEPASPYGRGVLRIEPSGTAQPAMP